MNYEYIKFVQDFNKDAKLVAVDLINAFNKTKFRYHKVNLGIPQKLDMRPDINWDENTFVTIQRSLDEAILDGSNEIFGLLYKRFSVQDIYNIGCVNIVTNTLPISILDPYILSQINNQLNVQFTERDLKDQVIITGGQITLKISKKSYAWYGEFCVNVDASSYYNLLSVTDFVGFVPFIAANSTQTNPYINPSNFRFGHLLNTNNNTNYTITVDYNIDNLSIVNNDPNHNTKLDIIPTDPYKITQEVTYTRLPLGILSELESHQLYPVQPVSVPYLPFTTYDILDDINSELGLNLIQSEIDNITYTEYQDRYMLRVQNNTSSIAWINPGYNFKVQHPYDKTKVRQSDNNILRVTEDGILRNTGW